MSSQVAYQKVLFKFWGFGATEKLILVLKIYDAHKPMIQFMDFFDHIKMNNLFNNEPPTSSVTLICQFNEELG